MEGQETSEVRSQKNTGLYNSTRYSLYQLPVLVIVITNSPLLAAAVAASFAAS